MTSDKKNSAVGKRIRARNRFMIFMVIVVFIVVCLFTPIFNITSVTVEGNKILTDKAVIEASGIKKGSNLFLADTDKGEKNINALGYVESVEIKRKFLSRIVIGITETSEAAYMTFSGNYVGISTDGKILSITKTGKLKPKKAVISGCALTGAKKGEFIEGKKQEKTEAVKLILKTLNDNSLLPQIKKIDVSDLKSVYFTLNSDTKIVIGKIDQLDYKLKCLNAVLDELGEVRGGKVDVSDPSNVIYEGGN